MWFKISENEGMVGIWKDNQYETFNELDQTRFGKSVKNYKGSRMTSFLLVNLLYCGLLFQAPQFFTWELTRETFFVAHINIKKPLFFLVPMCFNEEFFLINASYKSNTKLRSLKSQLHQ